MKNWLSASCETPRASAQPFQRCMGILASAHFASKTDSAGIPTPVTPSATPSATRPVASPASSSTTSTSAAAAPFTAMWNGMLARVGSLRPVLETMASLGMAQCLCLCQRSQGSEGRRDGWGPPNEDQVGLFGPTVVRWYPAVQHLDGTGFADLLRTLSPYRRLDASVREPLLDAIAQRIRTDLDDHATRHYLTVLRTGQRAH